MKITKITAQVKNPDRVNIFIDSKYAFSLTLNQLLETKIKIGTELDESECKKFEKLSADGKLRQRALEWMMLRPHSSKEVMDYFKKKDVDNEQAIQWLSDFQRLGYQDDMTFAKWWCEQRRRKNRSSKYIYQELRQKGVDSGIIRAILDDEPDGDASPLSELILKKKRQTKYQDKTKLTEYLLRQGYRYSDIVDALADKLA